MVGITRDDFREIAIEVRLVPIVGEDDDARTFWQVHDVEGSGHKPSRSRHEASSKDNELSSFAEVHYGADPHDCAARRLNQGWDERWRRWLSQWRTSGKAHECGDR